MFDDMEGDYVGEDEVELGAEEEAEIGALPSALQPLVRKQLRQAKARTARKVRRKITAPGPRATGGGTTNKTSVKRVPFGLQTPAGANFIQFTASSGTTLFFEVEPQRDFQAERLLITQSRSGTTATGLSVVTSIKVGDVEQLPSSGGVPVEMFSADATESAIDLSNCRGGIKLRITIVISAAPTMTDTVTITAGFYGKVVAE